MTYYPFGRGLRPRNPTPLRFAPCGDASRGAQSGTGDFAAQASQRVQGREFGFLMACFYERPRLKTPSLPSIPGTDGGETPGRRAAGMKADLPKAGKAICRFERPTKTGRICRLCERVML